MSILPIYWQKAVLSSAEHFLAFSPFFGGRRGGGVIVYQYLENMPIVGEYI